MQKSGNRERIYCARPALLPKEGQNVKQIHITETVLRDAQQSLIATRMPFSDFQGILDDMDKAGYHSIECWGGATFDSCLRYLNEDPWERLRNIKSHMKNTKLQMLLRGQNLLGYHHYSDDTVRRFVRKSIENGMDIIRIFDALNCATSRLRWTSASRPAVMRRAVSAIRSVRSITSICLSPLANRLSRWAVTRSASRIWPVL